MWPKCSGKRPVTNTLPDLNVAVSPSSLFGTKYQQQFKVKTLQENPTTRQPLLSEHLVKEKLPLTQRNLQAQWGAAIFKKLIN